MVVAFKEIKPSTLKADKLRLILLNRIRFVGRRILKDFERTVRTWDDKPEFGMLISLVGGPTVVVEPESGGQIWAYLDQGTSVRYATMAPDYKPKTVPKVLDSRAGGGRVLFISRQHPRPGIKARGWSKMITDKWRSRFKREMEDALRDFRKESGHAI